jgi:hypothetical protein
MTYEYSTSDNHSRLGLPFWEALQAIMTEMSRNTDLLNILHKTVTLVLSQSCHTAHENGKCCHLRCANVQFRGTFGKTRASELISQVFNATDFSRLRKESHKTRLKKMWNLIAFLKYSDALDTSCKIVGFYL